MNKQMDKQIDKQQGCKTDEQTDRQIDRQANECEACEASEEYRKMDRQTQKHTD